MDKVKEVNLGKYFDLPNPGLKSYLSKVTAGNSDEYRTTFYKGKTLKQVLDGWMPTVHRLNRKFPDLVNFEDDLAKKVGPLSIQKPLSERLDDIESYYDSIHLESKPISRSALEAVLREWGSLRGLIPRSQDRTVDLMKKSTSSGNPFFMKRRAVVDKTIPVRLRTLGVDIEQMLKESDAWPCTAILGWRGQEGGPLFDDVKQRVVWMFPFGVNVEELTVYQPAIEIAQRSSIVPAWVSMEEVDRRITKMFDTKGQNDLVVCTDFSKFDQHFNADMQNGAKYILERLLNNGAASRYWLEEVFPVKYKIPLLCSPDLMYMGDHGMGSGSGGTNFDETLTHRALQFEAAQSVKQRLNPNSQCLGDDGVLTYPGIDVKDVMQTYTSHGQEMNETKQYVSTHDCTYLRRWHDEAYRIDGVCVGVYATSRALGRLCEQERFYDPEKWGPKMVALRQLSIIENCKYHPLRNEFLEYCMKGDKFRLGLDIPGFLDDIDRLAREANELMPDFLGYTKSVQMDANHGISDWWVVKTLKSMR
jgi:hypothetical protein